MIEISAPNEILHQAALFFADVLGILDAETAIEINYFKNDISDGFCGDAGTHFEIGVSIDPDETLITLAHEMVHAKQYITGELRDCKDFSIWRDKVYYDVDLGSDAYYNLPWEKEAYSKQIDLTCKFVSFYFVEGKRYDWQ